MALFRRRSGTDAALTIRVDEEDGESVVRLAGQLLAQDNEWSGSVLDAIVDLAPPPQPPLDIEGNLRPLDESCGAFVFKVQANMDRSHRDRIAFIRICSGRFERGMVLTNSRTGKPFATKYASTVFGAERSTVVVIDTDPLKTTEAGGWWWDVAVPEVSDRPEVNAARRAYEAGLRMKRDLS